jgi:hypothetical protein
MKEKKNIQIWCNECHKPKRSEEFYSRLVEIGYKEELIYKDNANEICGKSTEKRSNGICKECLMNKYFKYLDDNNGDIKKSIYKLCKEYDLPYDNKHIDNLCKSTESCSGVLKTYIKNISSLSHYERGFEECVVHLGEIGTEASIKLTSEYKNTWNNSLKDLEEKSDIDFINDDIKRIKIHIQKALENDDVNQHGKWLNSLRDALELRNKLEGKHEICIPEHHHTVNLGNNGFYTTSIGGGTVIKI